MVMRDIARDGHSLCVSDRQRQGNVAIGIEVHPMMDGWHCHDSRFALCPGMACRAPLPSEGRLGRPSRGSYGRRPPLPVWESRALVQDSGLRTIRSEACAGEQGVGWV